MLRREEVNVRGGCEIRGAEGREIEDRVKTRKPPPTQCGGICQKLEISFDIHHCI